MKRYKELKFGDKTFTEQHIIKEKLIENGFEWFLDCEIENARIEILKNTLVFNSGVFFNGNWKYGVFRDGQWKYGTWEGGVWYNGTWYNGIFKNGIIFDGRFIAGKIEGGEIRGGEFFDVQISRDVVDNTVKKVEQKSKPQTGQPNNRGGQVQQQLQQEQPQGVQPEKIEERIITKFENFINESRTNIGWYGFKNSISSKRWPLENDDIGNRVLDYLNNNDVYVSYDIVSNRGKIFSFIISGQKNINREDPYNEESWGEDVEVKIERIIIRGHRSIVNDYILYLDGSEIENISYKLLQKILWVCVDKYEKQKSLEKERIKTENDAITRSAIDKFRNVTNLKEEYRSMYYPYKFASSDQKEDTDEEKIIKYFTALLGNNFTLSTVVNNKNFKDFCENNGYEKDYVLNIIKKHINGN